MVDDILVANTGFGGQVLAALDKPADDLRVGGLPLHEYLVEERRRQDAGQSSQELDDEGRERFLSPVTGEVIDTSEPAQRAPEQLFDVEAERMLFGLGEAAPETTDHVASNRAYIETLINNDPESFEQRKLANQIPGTVADAAVDLTRRLLVEQQIPRSGFLAPEVFDTLTPAEQLDAVTREVNRLDLREVTPLNVALIETFLAGGGKVTMPTFESHARQLDVSAIRERMEYRVRIARRKARDEVNSTVAALGMGGVAEAIVTVGYQDMTPVIPLLTRWGVLEGLAQAAGVENSGAFLLGEGRNNLRKALVAMSPEEFYEAAQSMGAYIKELEADPVKGVLVTRYNLLEQYEAVFTEDVFDGRSAKNTGDRWFGNAETLLETLFSVVIIAKVGKGVWRTFRAVDAVSARATAAVSDAPDVAARIDQMIQQDDLAVQFGLEADEAAATLLPRPPSFVDDVDNLPDGTKSVVERNERVRSEILESTDRLTGEVLTNTDRTNAVNREIAQIDMADGAHVQGRMSSLSMKDNGTGFDMRVVVGETAEGGWKSIDEAMDEALDIDPQLESVRIMRINADGVLEDVFENAEDFARAVTKGEVDPATAGRIAGGDNPDGTFYLAYDRERFWHTIDKESLGTDTFLSGGIVPRALLAPNAKFGDEIYGKFLRAYMGEQALLKNFEILFEPYYKLDAVDKRFVASAFEWMEDYGKQHGRAPTLTEIVSRYDGITENQINGMVALRDGMDTMHELFNRRLYRDWQALGYKSARPSTGALPTFHGNVLERGSVGNAQVYDPVTGKMVSMTAREVDDLYNAGGRVMELDTAIDAINETRSRATRILLREDAYVVGELSTKPMVYHPAYSMRFYDDPYFIVKETEGIKLNGSNRTGVGSVSTEAIRTAGTQGDAEHFMRRVRRADEERGVQGVTYRVVRANDLSNSESTLFQKQSIHREGRLFWDERNFDRLPDVNGSRATLEDPVRSLERGIGQAARQLTHEDTLKGIKNAWKNDYGDLIDGQLLERFNLQELSTRLKNIGRDTVDAADKARVKEARELIDYMRLIEGTESFILPRLREAALAVAVAVNKGTGLNSKKLENLAQTMDPFRAMRSIAFNAFMVFRPVRQALLQSSQIGYLAALDPLYVASPKFFTDAYALRRGLAELRKSGYDDGFSVASMAKAMGITQKEYRVLLREFDRSGLIDLVDVHSFAGGAGRFRKTALPTNDSPLGTIGYRSRQFTRGTRDWFQNVGFNFGERNNLTFTYNLALKRAMDRKGYKSVLDMNAKDWDDLKVEASNLALGMVRPNNFGYQTGALGVATQFLGFTHKAALGLLGANPALKGRDGVKIIFGTYLLYGANMYGARDLADEQLTNIGIPDQEIPGVGASLVDLISGGLIDSTFNMLGDLTVNDWKDIDTEFLAPGFNVFRLWEMQLQTVMDQPTKAVFGPFGNIFSSHLESLEFVRMVHEGMPDLDPVDKFTISANAVMSGILPAYNDAVKSYQGYQLNQWYSTSGEALPLRPTMNTILARGLFGARSREELSYYRLQNDIWNQQENYQDIVSKNKEFLSKMVTALSDGTMTREDVHRNIGAMVNFWEEWPESVRLQMLRDSMVETQNDSTVPTIYRQLVDSLKDRRLDSSQLDALVARFPDIPPEQQAQLRKLIQEAHESRMNVDVQAEQQIREEQQ